MCGIYLSSNLSTFEVLEEANKTRGNFSTGIFYVYKSGKYKLEKYKGGINWNEVHLPVGDDDDYIYLGHNQAPTSSSRDWKDETSHPFCYGDWMVAHNGILTNFEDLVDDYIPCHSNPVDSSIIPAMLAEIEYENGPCSDSKAEIINVSQVIDKLQGTFAVWIVNIKTMNVYIARQGCTLFYKDANISSIKGEGYKEVNEGIIYSYSSEGLIEQCKFTNKTPFLTL